MFHVCAMQYYSLLGVLYIVSYHRSSIKGGRGREDSESEPSRQRSTRGGFLEDDNEASRDDDGNPVTLDTIFCIYNRYMYIWRRAGHRVIKRKQVGSHIYIDDAMTSHYLVMEDNRQLFL